MTEKYTKYILYIIAYISLAGCNGGMESKRIETFSEGLGQSEILLETPETLPVTDAPAPEALYKLVSETEDLLEGTVELESAVSKQDKYLSRAEKITSILNILGAISSLKSTTSEKGLSNPLKSFVQKIMSVVERAYMLDDQLIENLEKIEAQLDPNNAEHIELLQKMDRIKERLEKYEEKVDSASSKLLEKVRSILRKIEKAEDKYLFFDPRKWLMKKAYDYFEPLEEQLEFYLQDS